MLQAVTRCYKLYLFIEWHAPDGLNLTPRDMNNAPLLVKGIPSKLATWMNPVSPFQTTSPNQKRYRI